MSEAIELEILPEVIVGEPPPEAFGQFVAAMEHEPAAYVRELMVSQGDRGQS